MLNMKKLIHTFENAIENNHDAIGVKIRTQGYPEDEYIINPNENFKCKLQYYRKTYDENLVLKTYSGIRIIGIASGKMENVLRKLEQI